MSTDIEQANKPRWTNAPGPLFTSRRERWLWAWTAGIVLTIYATLGFASTLAEVLQVHGVVVVVFLSSMFLVGAAILTQGLTLRIGGIEIGIALGIAVVYIMFFLRLTIPERSHLIEYSVVAVFIYEALRERARGGLRVPAWPILAIVVTSLVGAIDESIQLFLPNRVFDPVDILFNFLAATFAVVSLLVLGWARRWAKGKRGDRSRPAEPAALDPPVEDR